MNQQNLSLSSGERFQAPPPEDRPMAFWSWNGEMSREGIDAGLTDLIEHGFGGAFVHPRPGLVTEYLSDEWWSLWAHALAVAKRLGAELHIYDENSFPAGFAGGHVPAADPDRIATYATILPLATAEQAATVRALGFIALDAATAPGYRAVIRDDARALLEGGSQRVVAIITRRAEASPFMAGFGYVDLTHPDTTRLFIEKTHEEYRRRFADDFGGKIRFAFSDEPNPMHGDGFAYSAYIAAEFQSEHGYALEERWADLFYGDGSVRYDYFLTVDRLFLDNFVTPIDSWCRENGLGFTGHFWEHAWPSPGKQPDNLAAMARMAVPGNDLLEFQINRSEFWPKAVLNLKELSSAAAQNGATRTMVENGGAGGYGTGIREFRKTDTTLLGFGVSLFVAHLTHYSLAGARKYEWPQTMGAPASWWSHYGSHADRVARAVGMIVQSTEVNRVALLEPTRSGWVHFVPESARSTAPALAADHDEAMRRLGSGFTALVLTLYEAGIDFDLVDERSLEAATADGTNLTIGKRAYSLVAIASHTSAMGAQTRRTIEAAAAAGVPVLVAEPARVDGARMLTDDTALAAEIARTLPPRYVTGVLPRGVVWHRRVRDDGALFYVLGNTNDEPRSVEWRPEIAELHELRADDGTAARIEHDGTVRTALAPRDFRLFLAGGIETLGFTVTANEDRIPTAGFSMAAETPARVSRIEASDPNVLVVDYCTLRVDSRAHENVHVLAADRALWQAAGWHGNAWERAVQYRRAILDRTYRAIEPVIEYRFRVDDATSLTGNVDLVIERSSLYSVGVNGTPVNAAFTPWLINDFHRAPIGPLLRSGSNEITLAASAFHPLMEISPIMVTGEFVVTPIESGFAIRPGALGGVGDAALHGYPFYPHELAYRIEAPADFDYERAEIAFEFGGAFAEVVGAAGSRTLHFESPVRVEVDALPATIRVGANARNFWGPFHSEGLALAVTWAQSPEHQPPGSEYRLQQTGVLGAPMIRGIR